MGEGEQILRERFNTTELANKIERHGVSDTIPFLFKMYIEASDFFFIATANGNGETDCSFRGGGPGCVRVLDERTLAFPDFPGNGLFQSLGNLLENPHIGMLFIDFEKAQRLRINGTAVFSTDQSELAMFPGALSVIKVTIREVYTNCSRRIPKLVRA